MVSANAPFLPGGSIREGIAYAVGAFGIRAYELASGTLIFVARADGVLSAYTLSEPP